MRRRLFQHWSIILLLVSRLIFGELAHSAPHDMPMEPAPVAAHSSQEPCEEHATADGAAAHPAESAAGAHHGAAEDPGCCHATACECVCVHFSALAPPPGLAHLVLVDQGRLPVFAPRLAQQRPSALFRPPA